MGWESQSDIFQNILNLLFRSLFEVFTCIISGSIVIHLLKQFFNKNYMLYVKLGHVYKQIIPIMHDMKQLPILRN